MRWSLRSGVALSLAVVLLAGCSEKEGPVGAPGGRDGIELRYVTPRAQVVPATTSQTVTLALSIRQEGRGGELVPYEGAILEASRDEGRGELTSTIAVADARGQASFRITMPAQGDRTKVVVMLQRDRRSYLPFEIVAAPILPIEIPVGDIADVRPTAEGTLLQFPAIEDAEYLLVPYQTDRDRRANYRLFYQAPGEGADGSLAVPPRPRGLVRGPSEAGNVARGSVERELTPAAGIPLRLSTRSCRVDVNRMAPLRYLGQWIALYVDAPPDSHQARIDSLGRLFDEKVFPTNTELFGPTPDLDNNGRVLVVMTPELGNGGGVYCDSIRTLGVEAFYANWIPDDPIDRPLATLAHEHQHVINAGHHLMSRGAIGDERWLGEGLSLAAEALNGYLGGTLTRVARFLGGQNGGLSLLPLDYGDAFEGNYMLFVLYLGDRFGRSVYRHLGESGRAGVANVEHVTGVSFDELLRDWFIANAVSNRGLTDDPRYNYRSLDLHGMEEEIERCRCVPGSSFSGMWLEVLHLDLPFNIGRTLNGADADYYRLAAPGRERVHEVFVDGFGRATVRLAVIRAH